MFALNISKDAACLASKLLICSLFILFLVEKSLLKSLANSICILYGVPYLRINELYNFLRWTNTCFTFGFVILVLYLVSIWDIVGNFVSNFLESSTFLYNEYPSIDIDFS